MKVEEGKYSIAEIVDWFKRRELVVNTNYQRGASLWPVSAKSYFIDTILKDFPFPKVYFHERIDKKSLRPMREIVDGQQRLSTIVAFMDNEFRLGQNASGFADKRFSDLEEEVRDQFLSYTVSVDVIRNADSSEILQMFRRMNAFTLPLNAPEKRHSEFFGAFKDWVNTVLDRFGRLLIDWEIFSARQIVRMADAELIADIALAIEEGIVNTSPKKLHDIYKRHDKVFESQERIDGLVSQAFDIVRTELSEIQKTYICRPHVFHSLMCALIHLKFGIINAEQTTGIRPIGEWYIDREKALTSLKRLASAHEEKDFSEFREYVNAASEGGNRSSQRAVRIKWLCLALKGKIE